MFNCLRKLFMPGMRDYRVEGRGGREERGESGRVVQSGGGRRERGEKEGLVKSEVNSTMKRREREQNGERRNLMTKERKQGR
jgi:hypothetical protein